MPGLLRGIARTAVISGTATAVSGRVARRQAARFADRDARIVAQRQQAYEQQVTAPAPPAAARPAAPTDVMIEQLSQLAELKLQGVLTEQEFAEQKARILAG